MKDAIKLFPLFLFYVVIIILLHSDTLQFDESGYVHFAGNLTHGFYADKQDINLWWGPGYPIILMPFVAINSPVILMRLVNAVFLFCAVLYFYRTLCKYIDGNHLLLFSYLFGLYPPNIILSYCLLTESFSLFLASGFVYYFTDTISKSAASMRRTIYCSSFLAMLALTKVIFGYVLVVALICLFAAYLLYRTYAYKRSLIIAAFALMMCSPYLIYTYSVSGKIFYWGNSGGMSLYWMSTPYAKEYGDWKAEEAFDSNPSLWNHHHEFFDSLKGLNKVEADAKFKDKAIDNIAKKPSKFAINVLCNLGRIFFSYPFSYAEQIPTTYFYLFPNMFICVFLLIILVLLFTRKVTMPVELFMLLAFTFIYLAESSLLSAYSRMFNVTLPVIGLIIIYTIYHYVNRVKC